MKPIGSDKEKEIISDEAKALNFKFGDGYSFVFGAILTAVLEFIVKASD